MVLADAPLGVVFQVKGVLLDKEVGKRLTDMGFTRGASGSVVRRGVFGGPVQVHILNYDILIRRSEARGIEVEMADTAHK
jgi:Fe2+ transport system protein FeoA